MTQLYPSPTLFLAPSPLRLRPVLALLHGAHAPSSAAVCPTTVHATSQKPTLEPSVPIPTPPKLPPSLLSTTIYHNIPSVPEHHAAPDIAPLAHRNDGDGYVLALSFAPTSDAETWLRARFIRTRPFLVELRRRKRLYRGAYGTAGSVGLNAPVKPKASSARGVFPWGPSNNQRIVTYGIRMLPLALSRDVLVTRGPTALRAVLSDTGQMLQTRPSELSLPPLRCNDRFLIVGVSRAAVGGLIAAFVTELDEDRNILLRHPKIDIPRGCDVIAATVNDDYCVIAMHRVTEESAGPFSAVLGTGKCKEAPSIDVDYGTSLFVLSRATGRCATLRLPGIILTRLTHVSTAGSDIGVHAIQFFRQTGSNIVRSSTIADALHGHLWASSNGIASDFSADRIRVSLRVEDDGTALTAAMPDIQRAPLAENTVVCDVAAPPVSTPTLVDDAQPAATRQIYTIFDTARKCSGLAVCVAGSTSPTSDIWYSSDEREHISGVCMSPDGDFVSALVTMDGTGRLDIFAVDDVAKGAVESVPLHSSQLGVVGDSVSGVWADHAAEWRIDGDKPVKSSYEIFDSRDWNDINSNFSSLGF